MNTQRFPEGRPFIGSPRSLAILDQPVQFQPCAIRWTNMSPVEGGRFCTECNITLERAERYTSEELKSLLANTSSMHRCFRVTTLHNGQILTRDTPLSILLQEMRFRMSTTVRRLVGVIDKSTSSKSYKRKQPTKETVNQANIPAPGLTKGFRVATKKCMLRFMLAIAVAAAIVGVGIPTNWDITQAAYASYTNVQSYNDDRVAEAANVCFAYLNGSFGALVMIGMGLAAIVLACCRKWYTSLAALILGIATFVLRSLVASWYNTQGLSNLP